MLSSLRHQQVHSYSSRQSPANHLVIDLLMNMGLDRQNCHGATRILFGSDWYDASSVNMLALPSNIRRASIEETSDGGRKLSEQFYTEFSGSPLYAPFMDALMTLALYAIIGLMLAGSGVAYLIW
jgi:hypothetical protein